PDMMSIVGASAALHVSDIPFLGPIAAVRIGRKDGRFVINPLPNESEGSDLSLVVAGSRDSIVMVEGGAKVLPADVMLDALYTALAEMQPLIAIQEELREKLGRAKREVAASEIDPALREAVESMALPRITQAMEFVAKQERRNAVAEAEAEVAAA